MAALLCTDTYYRGSAETRSAIHAGGIDGGKPSDADRHSAGQEGFPPNPFDRPSLPAGGIIMSLELAFRPTKISPRVVALHA